GKLSPGRAFAGGVRLQGAEKSAGCGCSKRLWLGAAAKRQNPGCREDSARGDQNQSFDVPGSLQSERGSPGREQNQGSAGRSAQGSIARSQSTDLSCGAG